MEEKREMEEETLAAAFDAHYSISDSSFEGIHDRRQGPLLQSRRNWRLYDGAPGAHAVPPLLFAPLSASD
jgi:hypothetical protein